MALCALEVNLGYPEIKFGLTKSAQEVTFVLPIGTQRCSGGEIWDAQKCQK